MTDKINNYLKRQMYSKNISSCNYYILCDKEEYIGNVGNCKPIDKYKLKSLINMLVINTLTSILIDEGEINLNDRVKKFIPEFEFDDILIIHLLTNSSGLKSIKEKVFEPGSNVKINDINFKILKMIIEKIYTTDMELLARSLIFEPLAMNDTKIVKSNIVTTITDLSHFVKMILNNGFYNGKHIIDIKYIDMWFTPLYIGSNNIRSTIGWIFAPSIELCSNIPFSLNSICYDNNSYIIIDRDNELAIVLLFDKKVNLDKRCNINKYIYNELKKIGKIY